MSWTDDLIGDVRAVIVLQLDWASAHLFALTGQAQCGLVRELTARGLLKPTVFLHEPRKPLHPLSLMAYGHGHFGATKTHPWDTPDLADLVQFQGGHVYVRRVLDNWVIEEDRLHQEWVVRAHDRGDFEDYSDIPRLIKTPGTFPVYKATFGNFVALWDIENWRDLFSGSEGLIRVIRAGNVDLLVGICCLPSPYLTALEWIDVVGYMYDMGRKDMCRDFCQRVYGPGVRFAFQ
jgi:hypothetical protein